MDWQSVERNWAAFVPRIAERWPRMNAQELVDLDGDRARFTQYLSSTSDLTKAEAAEAVETWLMGEMPADVRMDVTRDDKNILESASHIPPGEDVYADDSAFGDDDVPRSPIGRSS